MVDFSVKVIFDKDKCQIPFSDAPIYIDYQTKYVEDMTYIATGNEGVTLNIPEIIGKKILLITREGMVQYEVSNNPQSTEFIWDGNVITLGLETNVGERYLILYRNY